MELGYYTLVSCFVLAVGILAPQDLLCRGVRVSMEGLSELNVCSVGSRAFSGFQIWLEEFRGEGEGSAKDSFA